MQITTAQSPPFGYLSPPIDGCDASSEDGDSLQTPLTEHEEHHQPYAVYHQFPHGLSHHLFNPAVSSDSPAEPSSHHHPRLSFHHLLTPLASDKLAASSPSEYITALNFSPPLALDLANASLEFNPFAVSFAGAFNSDSGSSPQGDARHEAFALDTQPLNIMEDPFAFLTQQYELGTTQPTTTPADSIELPTLPPLCASSSSTDTFNIDNLNASLPADSLLLSPSSDKSRLETENLLEAKGRMYSPRFPAEHSLNPYFVTAYELGDELGAGGYGFVMTARHRLEGYEVAVKFIIKDKVPEHAWWEDDLLGRVPT